VASPAFVTMFEALSDDVDAVMRVLRHSAQHYIHCFGSQYLAVVSPTSGSTACAPLFCPRAQCMPARHVTKRYTDPPNIALYIAQLLGMCTQQRVFPPCVHPAIIGDIQDLHNVCISF
jgi:hypothetical protein